MDFKECEFSLRSGSECLPDSRSGSASSSTNGRSRDSRWCVPTEWLFYTVDESVFSKPPLFGKFDVFVDIFELRDVQMLPQISEMSLFRTILVFMLETKEFTCYSNEQTMFFLFVPDVQWVNPKQRLPAVA